MLFRSVPLLTLGMATGVGLSLIENPAGETVRLSEPSIIISVLSWVAMMALFVWLLVASRTPGKLVAWRTMWAFGFLLLTLIVLEVFSHGGVHGVTGTGIRNSEFGIRNFEDREQGAGGTEEKSARNTWDSVFRIPHSEFRIPNSHFA